MVFSLLTSSFHHGRLLRSSSRRRRLWERLHHLGEAQREYSDSPVDLATPPLLTNELEEGDDVTLGEGELVLLVPLVVEQGGAARAAENTARRNEARTNVYR